ncbi:MAG: lysylphosphatidylglycerol synthase domain-containing protein [Gammaproteobacteria bacterium]
MTTAAKHPITALLWPALMLFMLGSLFAALNWYFAQDLEGFSLASLSAVHLLIAVSLQFLAIAAVVLSWHINLRGQGIHPLAFDQSVIMVGISTIGKYTPGKVWGMLARGALLYRHTGQSKSAVVSALVEQVALLHSGLLLTLTFFLAYYTSWWLGFITLVALLPSFWLIARSDELLAWILSKLGKESDLALSGFRASYPSVCCSLTVMWIPASAVLWYALLAYSSEQPPQLALVLLASMLSYIGGFAAFFAPAGIGVREGLVVALLGPVIGINAAMYIALLHRLITAGVDISLGMLALLLHGLRNREAEQHNAPS